MPITIDIQLTEEEKEKIRELIEHTIYKMSENGNKDSRYITYGIQDNHVWLCGSAYSGHIVLISIIYQEKVKEILIYDKFRIFCNDFKGAKYYT